MSLMSMRKKMASQKTITIVLWVLIVAFIAGIFLIGNPNRNSSGPRSKEDEAVVATVNTVPIKAYQINDAYNQLQAFGRSEIGMENAREKRKQVFNNLIQDILLEQALKEKSIKVNDRMMKDFARSMAESQLISLHKNAAASAKADQEEAKKPPKPAKDGEKLEAPKQPKSEEQYFQESLAQYIAGMTNGKKPPANPSEGDYVNALIKSVMNKEAPQANGNMNGAQSESNYVLFRKMVANQLLGRTLLSELNSGADQFTEEFVKQTATQEVKASWIFIIPDPDDPKGMDGAKARAEQVRKTLQAKPAQFSDIAKKESRDFMTAGMGGDLGWIKAGGQQQMPTPIMVERFAFANKPAAISEPMFVLQSSQFFGTNAGYAIVKVDAVRPRTDIPKEFNWDAEKGAIRYELRTRYEMSFGQEYIQQLKLKADIKAETPELKIYVAEDKQMDRTPEIAKQRELAAYQTDLPQIVLAAFQYDLAMTLYDKKDAKKKIALLESVSQSAGQNMPRIQILLGKEHLKIGKNKLALEQFGYAKVAAIESQDRGMLTELRGSFKAAGDLKTAQEIDKWLNDHPAPKQPAGGMGQPGIMGM